MKTESANAEARQPDYLKLGYEFSMARGLRVVLFDRQNKEHNESLMSRVLGRFMQWSAGHWIAHHIKKQLPDEQIARAFVKNIRAQGGVRRDELVDFLSEEKIRHPKKNILPSDSHLLQENREGERISLTLNESENILIRHLIDDSKSQTEGKEFTKSNIQVFLNFVKNNCKISDPSDVKLIKELSSFCEAFDEKRMNRSYSFFILRNHVRVIFLKRELDFAKNPSIQQSGVTGKIQSFNYEEDRYRKKFRETPEVISRLSKNASSQMGKGRRKLAKEEKIISSLEAIDTKAFTRYFYFGVIDEKNRKELSDRCNSYFAENSELKKNICSDLSRSDPLYGEIIEDTFSRLQKDLKSVAAAE